MNCDLLRSHGRLFAHWTCLYFLLCFKGRNFVSSMCKLKRKKNYKNLKKTKKNYITYFLFKNN